MDNLSKQFRGVSFSGAGEDYQNYKSGQKSASSKRELRKIHDTNQKKNSAGRRGGDNRFQRQFSGEMSNSDGTFETAVAAAAYAITLREQQDSMNNQKRITTEEQRGPLTKNKSKREDSMNKPSESKLSRWLTRKDTKEDAKPPGSSSTAEDPAKLGKLLEEEHKLPGKRTETSLTIKKTPTFSDKYLNDTGNVRDQRGQTWQRAPSASKPSSKENGGRNGNNYSGEDAWTRAKMAEVQKRYEKSQMTTLEWENKERTKAKRRKERKESELEGRRTRVHQEYRDEILRIDKVAGRARAIADELRRDEEAKVLEKARKKQSDGETLSGCCNCQ